MLNEEGDAEEEEEVDPLDAFMAAEVLPEVKAREEEERKKAAEERAKLQELLKVRCACFGGHALGADVGRRGCVWGPCVVSWMLGLLGMLRLPMAGCCAAMPHLCGYECGCVCAAGWVQGGKIPKALEELIKEEEEEKADQELQVGGWAGLAGVRAGWLAGWLPGVCCLAACLDAPATGACSNL
jgi:hypothetical protein